MEHPFYDFRILDDAFRYDFKSVGKIVINKTIIYQKTSIENFYSLSMGDLLSDGTLDFETRSNNGDRDTILATIIKTLQKFLEQYPESYVGFTGSSPARTRTYQILINKELNEISKKFVVEGYDSNGLEEFTINKNYEGFVISLKKNTFDT
ncbi:MAG: hypothetical protein U5N85_10140 [Arcicella sp.]|nr:hypothetical protein [Arcicella sp.]